MESILGYHFHWGPIEIENLEYYRFEMHLENLKDILEDKKNAEENAYKDQNKKMPKMPNSNSMKPPKLPSIGNFKP